MDLSLQEIRERLPVVLDKLEDTVYKAAREVRFLNQAGCEDYADAILCQNSFGSDTAEIYFYRFAPRGSPRPGDEGAFQALMADSDRYKSYKKACYETWAQGITVVQKVVKIYGGEIEVDGSPLNEYLTEMKNAGQMPGHTIRVKILVPRQNTLRKLREILSESGEL